jgi:riboflavin kinase/FMN adenylyltransferase
MITPIVESLDQVSLEGPAAITIGTFDGVHLGHQALIHHVVERARTLAGQAALITFHPHPRSILRPNEAPLYLQSTEERLKALTTLGLDLVVNLQFDEALAQTRAEDFVNLLVERLHIAELWVGRNFALGRDREGDVPFLKALGLRLGFSVHPIRRVAAAGAPISSSAIRGLVSKGEVGRAARLLGRHYQLAGRVVRGANRGAQIGFPTANLEIAANRLLPADGVYATWVQLDQQWLPGATNIGVRPTFDNGGRTVETHIIGWEGVLYDQTLKLAFVKRLRGEQRFSSRDALVTQLKQDIAETEAVLSRVPAELPPCETTNVTEA